MYVNLYSLIKVIKVCVLSVFLFFDKYQIWIFISMVFEFMKFLLLDLAPPDYDNLILNYSVFLKDLKFKIFFLKREVYIFDIVQHMLII